MNQNMMACFIEVCIFITIHRDSQFFKVKMTPVIPGNMGFELHKPFFIVWKTNHEFSWDTILETKWYQNSKKSDSRSSFPFFFFKGFIGKKLTFVVMLEKKKCKDQYSLSFFSLEVVEAFFFSAVWFPDIPLLCHSTKFALTSSIQPPPTYTGQKWNEWRRKWWE